MAKTSNVAVDTSLVLVDVNVDPESDNNFMVIEMIADFNSIATLA